MNEILKLFGGTENIWAIIQENAPKVGIEATRIMLELFYVMKSPETGMINKSLIVAALGYQLLPEDVLPRDKFGLLGLLDNGITLAFAYKRVKSSVTPEIEQQVNNVLRNWFEVDSYQAQPNQGISENTNTGDYAPHPAYNPQVKPGYHPSSDINYGNDPRSLSQKPIWDDEDDVVID